MYTHTPTHVAVGWGCQIRYWGRVMKQYTVNLSVGVMPHPRPRLTLPHACLKKKLYKKNGEKVFLLSARPPHVPPKLQGYASQPVTACLPCLFQCLLYMPGNIYRHTCPPVLLPACHWVWLRQVSGVWYVASHAWQAGQGCCGLKHKTRRIGAYCCWEGTRHIHNNNTRLFANVGPIHKACLGYSW